MIYTNEGKLLRNTHNKGKDHVLGANRVIYSIVYRYTIMYSNNVFMLNTQKEGINVTLKNRMGKLMSCIQTRNKYFNNTPSGRII